MNHKGEINMYIKNIMEKEVITVREGDTVEECAKLLSTHNLSGLPVVDDEGKVKGIVTEGDLIRRAANVKPPEFFGLLGGTIYLESPKKFMDKLKKSMAYIVKDIMSEDLITVGPDSEIEAAATLMVQKKIKTLPVVDKEGKLLGVIARKDIMNYLFDID